jgi:hypothetical protein
MQISAQKIKASFSEAEALACLPVEAFSSFAQTEGTMCT